MNTQLLGPLPAGPRVPPERAERARLLSEADAARRRDRLGRMYRKRARMAQRVADRRRA